MSSSGILLTFRLFELMCFSRKFFRNWIFYCRRPINVKHIRLTHIEKRTNYINIHTYKGSLKFEFKPCLIQYSVKWENSIWLHKNKGQRRKKKRKNVLYADTFSIKNWKLTVDIIRIKQTHISCYMERFIEWRNIDKSCNVQRQIFRIHYSKRLADFVGWLAGWLNGKLDEARLRCCMCMLYSKLSIFMVKTTL